MTWIETVPFDEAEGKLKTLYERVTGPGNNVDNIMLAHSLRPHTLEGHMAIYKAVLHHFGNELPKSLLETLGVYVSLLNKCDYCVEHHFAGLLRLLDDDDKANQIRRALEVRRPSDALDIPEAGACNYASKLTLSPHEVDQDDIQELRDLGFDDGAILEINQVVAYFSYANRTVLGLGVSTGGDIIGLSPNASENPEDWSHS